MLKLRDDDALYNFVEMLLPIVYYQICGAMLIFFIYIFLSINFVSYKNDILWGGILVSLYEFAVGIFYCRKNYILARMIQDMPISKIASAAEGYTKLCGRCEKMGNYLNPPMDVGQVVWYKYYRFSAHRSPTVYEMQESDTPFMLDDGCGEKCVITTKGAAKLIIRKTNNSDFYEYNQYNLCEGDTVCIIGDFITKKNVHYIRQPEADKLFLISDLDQDSIAFRLKFWCLFYLFMAALFSYIALYPGMHIGLSKP